MYGNANSGRGKKIGVHHSTQRWPDPEAEAARIRQRARNEGGRVNGVSLSLWSTFSIVKGLDIIMLLCWMASCY